MTESYTQETLSIAQLIVYNSMNSRKHAPASSHHANKRETPSQLYLGIMIHCQTRKKGLIDKFFKLGLSVSYTRILTISADITNSLCRQYQNDGFVCPSSLREGLFTLAAVDNIDHNPSATSAKSSFHGTGISLFQNTRSDNQGAPRPKIDIDHTTNIRIAEEVPESYAIVKPVSVWPKNPEGPEIDKEIVIDKTRLLESTTKEYRWLHHMETSTKPDTVQTTSISWGAYHSNHQSENNIRPAISALMPLFEEEAKSVAMRHSMDVIKTCILVLNPDQVPVIAFDQPLYALAKQIQWKWPNLYGEDKFFYLFGGLHIEMAILKTIGDWLEASGWTNAISQAQIASACTSDSFLKASHVTRTRRAHQVTACALNILLKTAYAEYVDGCQDNAEILSLDEWIEKMQQEHPQFNYRYMTLQLEIDALIFISSIRQGDFELYIEALSYITPWFFALDHIHYSRWLPVHVRDLALLQDHNPRLFHEFSDGQFVVFKSKKKFSRITVDHAHEQNNALVKSDGGAIGLTESPVALRRWMIAGPEMARLVQEFEISTDPEHETESDELESHHEDIATSTQLAFHRDVTALCRSY